MIKMDFYKSLYLQEHGDDKLEADMDETRLAQNKMNDCPYHTCKSAGDEAWDYCTIKLRDFQITEDDCRDCEASDG